MFCRVKTVLLKLRLNMLFKNIHFILSPMFAFASLKMKGENIPKKCQPLYSLPNTFATKLKFIRNTQAKAKPFLLFFSRKEIYIKGE